MQRPEDDLEAAMRHIRKLQNRERELSKGGNEDTKRHGLLESIRAELARLGPVRRAYIAWRFFGAGRPGGQARSA